MGEESEPPPLPPRNYSLSELENDGKGDSKLKSKVNNLLDHCVLILNPVYCHIWTMICVIMMYL